ncbi:galactose-1-epimerase [Pseudodesulfovibrio sp. JC047]|uniref:aldose epimerase family protein n=1 Tax=Pseudodesulfovibrio sp. JC047 TaxID=2683199 RepID=UPI0013D4EDAC|nr:aldose epimerase family protein [Pseudodesulfovibrio sp. JC047]NDV20684.1 galactose-1-epimerase [Pseudodesulfovibrio sp. JC047]
MTLSRTRWGVLDDGTPVDLFTLTNTRGMEVSIATYGGIVTRLTAPDRAGNLADVVLGFDALDAYVEDRLFFGRLVGRVANRIGHGCFPLNGQSVELEKNCGCHHLHGGEHGFHTQVWDAMPVSTDDGPGLELRYVSPDGEQGYPGTVECAVRYVLSETGLRLDFSAETDAPTVVNMTHHGYFNLSGQPGTDCLSHRLRMWSNRVLALDADQIPTGRLLDVAGTPLDFTREVELGSRFPEQGYDQYYVLDQTGSAMRQAASVYEPVSGRGMEVWTTAPGVQVYSGNHIPESLKGKDGARYGVHSGVCFEAQGFVDAPNHTDFPSVVLEPGQTFFQTIEFRFFVK